MIRFLIKDIVKIGLFMGLHFALNLPCFKIFVPICLGTISFKIFPLFLIALNFSFLKSLIIILICSLFDWFISGYQFFCFLFDYAIPYLAILIANLFKENILKNSSVFLGFIIFLIFLIRLLSHTISGYLFYEISFFNSLIYNFQSCFINDFINFLLLTLFLRNENTKIWIKQ